MPVDVYGRLIARVALPSADLVERVVGTLADHGDHDRGVVVTEVVSADADQPQRGLEVVPDHRADIELPVVVQSARVARAPRDTPWP